MRNRFDEQLEILNVELIRMGALCEDAISYASRTLMGEGDFQRTYTARTRKSIRKSGILRTCVCGFCSSSSRWRGTYARYLRPSR